MPYATGASLRQYIMELENMGVVVHLNIEILENFNDFKKSLSMLGNIPVITLPIIIMMPIKCSLRGLWTSSVRWWELF